MKFFRLFLTFLALILVVATASAEIYQWVDENGVVHFSDSPTQSGSEASRHEDASSPGPDSEEKVSSPNPNAKDHSPPATETRKITLDHDLFKLLDESKPDLVRTHAPAVEIYETSW